MQVGTELTVLALALHRGHHLAADHQATDVGATGLGNELLDQNVGFEPHEGLDHALCRFLRLRQYHADALGALQQLDHRRGTADHLEHVLHIVGRVREAGHREADALARQQLKRAQLVSRAGNRDRLVERVDAHHLELAQHRGAVKGHRCADAWDHRIEAVEVLALVVDRGTHRSNVHIAAQHVEHANFVAALLGGLDQAPRRVQLGVARQYGNFHWGSLREERRPARYEADGSIRNPPADIAVRPKSMRNCMLSRLVSVSSI